METFAYSYITQGNPTSISDESLYTIHHQSNRVFIDAIEPTIVYHDNPNNLTPSIPQEINIVFRLDHQIVPDDIRRITYGPGEQCTAMTMGFTQPLSVFDSYEQARPAFQHMFSRFGLSFESRPEFGELHWGNGGIFQRNDPIQGLDGAVDRVSMEYVGMISRVLEEATRPGAMRSIMVQVWVLKRTVVDAERFRAIEALAQSLRRQAQDQDDDPDSVWTTVETVSYGGDGDDLECSICLSEVVIGEQVAKLPCSHRFHETCIASWLDRSQTTCPLCRFQLVNDTN